MCGLGKLLVPSEARPVKELFENQLVVGAIQLKLLSHQRMWWEEEVMSVLSLRLLFQRRGKRQRHQRYERAAGK